MTIVPLEAAIDVEQFGGKAVALGQALRAGLPVPSGHGLSVALVDAVAQADPRAEAQVLELLAELDPSHAYAIRSSAADEDSRTASFAGQHLTKLCVRIEPLAGLAVLAAIREVWASGRTRAAQRYRARLGLPPAARVAVVVQRMLVPECAGVLFTRDPISGADQRVIEGSWGLGEAVVSGLVTPDRIVMARGGQVHEHTVNDKDLAIEAHEDGVREVAIPADRASAPCLDEVRLAALDALACACEAEFEGPSDIEWAFEGPTVFLLQRRAITR
jgi:pyruvate,water dikinase